MDSTATTRFTSTRAKPCTAAFTMIGVAGRRLRVGQWHAGAGGTPLIMLSGIGMNMEMLEPVARQLPHRHLISVDMPGIGKSPDPIFPYTIAQIALTLAALFDRLGIDVVDLLGISWGGAVAQQFAFQHRARTGRLILASTSSGSVMMPAIPAISGPAMPGHLFDPKEYTVEATLRRSIAGVYNGGGAGQVSLNAATAPSPLGYTYQIAAFAAWSSAPFLPLLAMPVMVMADNEDQLIPVANAHFMHNAIPDSRIELSDGGGHLFMLTHPERFATLVEDFLD